MTDPAAPRQVLIDLDDSAPAQTPATAPPPPDPGAPSGAAMQAAMRLGRARLPWWARLIWAAVAGFVGLVLSVAAWDFAAAMLTRHVALGWFASAALGLIALGAVLLALREGLALRRLRRIDGLRASAKAALDARDRNAALRVSADLRALYAPRAEMAWARDRQAQILPDQADAQGVLEVTEVTLLSPLDQQARHEVELAARQVALLTAMIPMALVDMAAALAVNLRLIRRIAQIYGGRAGMFGSLRLLRAVVGHLMATGLLAVSDDLLGSVAGGGALSKVSRRFGEGVVNGALCVRLGLAAMDVCRPLPFAALPRPRTSNVMSRALVGLFDRTAG